MRVIENGYGKFVYKNSVFDYRLLKRLDVEKQQLKIYCGLSDALKSDTANDIDSLLIKTEEYLDCALVTFNLYCNSFNGCWSNTIEIYHTMPFKTVVVLKLPNKLFYVNFKHLSGVILYNSQEPISFDIPKSYSYNYDSIMVTNNARYKFS